MSMVNRREGRVDIGKLIKVVVSRVVVELQLLGSHPWQMIPLFVIVGMEKGGTTCPTYEHHNEQNKKSVNENSSVGRNLNFVWVTLDHFFMVVFPMLCKTLPRTSAFALMSTLFNTLQP